MANNRFDWDGCGSYSTDNDAVLYSRVEQLVGTPVQIHTNRTQKNWSVWIDDKSGCIAYIQDAVLLKGVTWKPASIAAARQSYFPQSASGKQVRNVQAFCEGELIYAENDPTAPSRNFGVDCWEAIVEHAKSCDFVEFQYNPKDPSRIAFFHKGSGDEGIYIMDSDFAYLYYDEDRRVHARAYCDIRQFELAHVKGVRERILCPKEAWLKKRYSKEGGMTFDEFLKTEQGKLWRKCERTFK